MIFRRNSLIFKIKIRAACRDPSPLVQMGRANGSMLKIRGKKTS